MWRQFQEREGAEEERENASEDDLLADAGLVVDGGRNTNPTSQDDDDHDLARTVPAKARLHAICTAYKWKQPTFECCKEEGMAHLKLFTFKVIVEIVDAQGTGTTLECFGAPRPKKKAAAEDAAEGALWYLKQCGYILIINTKRTQGDKSEEGSKKKKPKKAARCTADLNTNTSQMAAAC